MSKALTENRLAENKYYSDRNMAVARLVAAEICEVYGKQRIAFELEGVNGDTLDRALSTASQIVGALAYPPVAGGRKRRKFSPLDKFHVIALEVRQAIIISLSPNSGSKEARQAHMAKLKTLLAVRDDYEQMARAANPGWEPEWAEIDRHYDR